MNVNEDENDEDGLNAFSDDSDSDDAQDAEWNDLERLPNGRRDIKHAVAKLIVAMRSSSTMTRVGVTRAITGAELILKVNNMSLRQDVSTYLTSIGVVDLPQAQALLNKFNDVSPFDGSRSKKGQVSTIQKYYSFIKPEPVFIDERLDQRLQNDAIYRQVAVPNQYQYVSVIKILTLIASKPIIMQYVRSRRPSEDGMLYGYTDGDQYRNSPFFREHPDAFQCVLYYDGIDAARGLGPKSGLHEIGNFLIIVLNVPSVLNSSLAGLHPVVLANTLDCKGTFINVLSRFVGEMQRLEQGVRVFVNGEFVEIFASLVAVKGDTKAVHEVLGFLGSGARHFCRLCMISRQELHSGEVVLGERRTPEMTEEQLQRVARNEAYTTQCGLRYRSCLHDIQHFHSTSNLCFDLMHDGPEGVILMLIRLCLKQFICVEQLFSVEDLNQRIDAFQYGRQNQKDKPTPNFSLDSLREANTVHKQKQNAAQTLVLFRALPLILDDIGTEGGVPEDHEHLKMLLLLSKIWKMGFAPHFPRNVAPFLRRLLLTFHRNWYIVFPDVDPINKFHFLQHLVENLLEMGPQRQFSCFREEGKNCPIRRHVATCNNFINPHKTTLEQAQIYQAGVWGTGSDNVVLPKNILLRRVNVVVSTLPVSRHLQGLGFNAQDEIRVATAAIVNSFEYRVGDFILFLKASEDPENLPRFGKILNVICPENTDLVWCAVQTWSTDGHVERFEAYQVSVLEGGPVHLIDVQDLPLHAPLSRWRDYTTNRSYLSLKHAVY